ncbi:MAG: hypothetical protein M1834_007239 [Cirrosporium novae-zelandiae]|nr:MAG: hypothetical protein M1834_007239 [Cirrosporium novae-zelandiae]
MTDKTIAKWTLESQQGIESLVFDKAAKIPCLGELDVLVRIYAASLNYRDLVIADGSMPLPISPHVVPGSDGAGIVEAVGLRVTEYKTGDKVCTHMLRHSNAESDEYIAENEVVTLNHIENGLGEHLDGTLCQYGVFHESCLVRMPSNLSFLEASTLTCSALTAWNALYGLPSKAVKKGDVVLTQGTGGVSIAALQFAVAAGATVIATTSSDAKAVRLTSLGARTVINYKTHPNWGEEAKRLTPNGKGVDIVVDIGGLNTLPESLKAVSAGGLVIVGGLVAGIGSKFGSPPTLLECLWKVCTVRGIVLGTKVQFRDMVAQIESKGIKPVVDEKVFGLKDVKEAYQFLKQQKHFSKVVIEINKDLVSN